MQVEALAVCPSDLLFAQVSVCGCGKLVCVGVFGGGGWMFNIQIWVKRKSHKQGTLEF